MNPVVVMGVSGSGKSTLGVALAARLGVPFEDADDLHPRANVDKMARGEALDDGDRWPWLDLVGGWLAAHPEGGVVACSALKRSYRDRLRGHCPGLEVLFLDVPQELLEQRMAARQGHFMPASLLGSQLDTLEPLAADERGVVVDANGSVEETVAAYLAARSKT